jgi:hypothetical protein
LAGVSVGGIEQMASKFWKLKVNRSDFPPLPPLWVRREHEREEREIEHIHTYVCFYDERGSTFTICSIDTQVLKVSIHICCHWCAGQDIFRDHKIYLLISSSNLAAAIPEKLCK